MLESRSLDVGIVTSIVGIRRLEIVFQGEADHAGTTPMAARTMLWSRPRGTVSTVRQTADALAAEGPDYFVATVGILTVEPSASNVVPGRCRLVIDVRTTDPALTERFVEQIDRRKRRECRRGAGDSRFVRDLVRWTAGRLRRGFARRVAAERA